MQKAAQAYFQTQLTTTSQGDLLLLLYEGAIKFLKQAKVKIEERDYAEKGILISKAMDVVAELDSSLNVQKGGDLAQNLHHLYFFCNTRLLKANMTLDTAIIDEVIKVLSGLQEAFQQIIKEGAQAAQPAATQSVMPRTSVGTSKPAPAANANANGMNGSMLAGGLLRPKVGAVPQNAAAAAKPANNAQPVNSRPAVRPLGANGVARAVQFSQNSQLEQAPPAPSGKQQGAGGNAPKSGAKSAPRKQPAATPSQVAPDDMPQPQAAAPKPKKRQPVPKQQPSSDMEQDKPTVLPKQPLNFNKARMLAGYKKMASQS